MSTAAEAIKNVAAALRAELRATVDATNAALKDSPERSRDITARATALREENARRAAAGVRVNLSPDSFDARHAKLLQDNAHWHETAAKARTNMSNALTATLLRALQSLDTAATLVDAIEARDAEAARVAAESAAAASRSYRPGYGGRS